MVRTFLKVAGVLALALVVAGAAFLAGLRLPERFDPFPSEPFEEIGPTVLHSVRELSQLTTVEVVQYTTVEKGNDRGWLNWARGDRIFLFAVARIGAGVDLALLTEESFEVDEEGMVILRLPPPEILYVAPDNEATRVYDRDTGIFTRGDPRLETEARQVAEQVLLEQALEEGILDRANESAVLALTEFLKGLGYAEVRVITR